MWFSISQVFHLPLDINNPILPTQQVALLLQSNFRCGVQTKVPVFGEPIMGTWAYM